MNYLRLRSIAIDSNAVPAATNIPLFSGSLVLGEFVTLEEFVEFLDAELFPEEDLLLTVFPDAETLLLPVVVVVLLLVVVLVLVVVL